MEPASVGPASVEPSSVGASSMEPASVEASSVESCSVDLSTVESSNVEPSHMKRASADRIIGMEPASVDNLRVLYQSSDFILVDKHWDIRIDSKMWYEKQTVQRQLGLRFPHLADPGTYYGFRFCHQLDYSTSGVLCVALSKAAAGRAYSCFKDRRATKAYLALVRGWLESETMTLDFPIGKNTTEGRTHMMCVQSTEGCENPKPCETQLLVLEYGFYDDDPVTKVLLQPLTGRTHQLRVHCQAVGHPIVGDYTYSLGADSTPYRMMLHAHLLHLPLEPRPLQATAPDPFTTQTDPHWCPQRRLRSVDGAVETLLQRRAEEERKKREKEKQLEEDKRMRGRRKGREVNEEQRRTCQQWLSEWAED
ncbi:hypothetical protein DPEC_G00274350 [Dallia pectoralis]|uniref:Uncharacterized protein n=1 Tax=Dallia pectoralis TaxID=75939 RepID=A0ACC2FLC0_DALPE|nr:hypothetical protein DPEC_G00274350 [Dallia pectoralis]